MLSNTARLLRTQLHRGISVKLTAFVYMTRSSECFDRTVYADTIHIIYMIFVLDSVNLEFLSNSLFYRRETRFYPSREEHILSVLGHRFPKKIYKTKRGEVKTER
jgi:membrane-associated PAP2 superfamily phosphatase